ncbi:hypothetical protein C8F04DRAFT_1203230 [Mycena alexandri]|uniref:Uncharacterized protein n=1 Tax=Mycena alexandri TaxID=1745969 RepID=A0AAD6WLZ2_9AGAR|nr:hypothetical protein C8F04DRAFT_1203230 [Mycena alexandri]
MLWCLKGLLSARHVSNEGKKGDENVQISTHNVVAGDAEDKLAQWQPDESTKLVSALGDQHLKQQSHFAGFLKSNACSVPAPTHLLRSSHSLVGEAAVHQTFDKFIVALYNAKQCRKNATIPRKTVTTWQRDNFRRKSDNAGTRSANISGTRIDGEPDLIWVNNAETPKNTGLHGRGEGGDHGRGEGRSCATVIAGSTDAVTSSMALTGVGKGGVVGVQMQGTGADARSSGKGIAVAQMQGIQAEVALCNARMQRAWVKAAMQDPRPKASLCSTWQAQATAAGMQRARGKHCGVVVARFGSVSSSGHISLNAELEPGVRFSQCPNPEPEPAFRFGSAFERVRTYWMFLRAHLLNCI